MADGVQPVITSVRRIQPTPAVQEPQRTYLSIVDATTATFGASSALWVFENRQNSHAASASEAALSESLAHTLGAYPHFAGRLQLTPWPENGPHAVPHTQRFRRSVVDYGYANDPGLEVQMATLKASVSSIIPDTAARGARDGCWDLTDTHTDLMALFDPSGEMAGNVAKVAVDAPAARVRITTFACGSTALAIKLAHPLADAEAMIAFMKAWGANHVSLARGAELKILRPAFDPSILDRCAAGDIDGPTSDEGLVSLSLSLPLPRFDWWAHEPGKPAYMDNNPQVVIPSEIPSTFTDTRFRGPRIPWEEWDTTAPTKHRIYRIAADEVQSIYESASPRRATDLQGATRPSRHDALLAFIWQLIARAKPPSSWPVAVQRSVTGSETEPDLRSIQISLDTTLGLRARLGLPNSFVGSPVLLAGMSQPYSVVTGLSSEFPTQPSSPSAAPDASAAAAIDVSALRATAAAIRTHLAAFDRPALAAWLHEQAFALAPQRLWNGFLGARHTMATSWVRAGVWGVDFGFGSLPMPPSPSSSSTSTNNNQSPTNDATAAAATDPSSNALRWAGVMGPILDGLVVLTEGPGPHGGRDWWRNGVDVDVKLEARAADRVHALLRRWRAERAQQP